MSYYGRYRNYYSSSDPHYDRVVRAFEQPLRLLQCKYYPTSAKWELRISSSTGGGHYDIMFNHKKASCTCPDFERRGKPCKHMLCVLLRILKLKNKEFTTITQVGKSYDQITPAFLALFHHDGTSASSTTKDGKTESTKDEGLNGGTAATSDSKNAEEATADAPVEEETCLICLLDFAPNDETMCKCSSHCQRWLGHKECLDSWFRQSKQCPLCKGIQEHLRKTYEPSYKRIRYGYSTEENVDIEALQAQDDDETIVDANAFFQIVQE